MATAIDYPRPGPQTMLQKYFRAAEKSTAGMISKSKPRSAAKAHLKLPGMILAFWISF